VRHSPNDEEKWRGEGRLFIDFPSGGLGPGEFPRHPPQPANRVVIQNSFNRAPTNRNLQGHAPCTIASVIHPPHLTPVESERPCPSARQSIPGGCVSALPPLFHVVESEGVPRPTHPHGDCMMLAGRGMGNEMCSPAFGKKRGLGTNFLKLA
jgi:hypothetical protein